MVVKIGCLIKLSVCLLVNITTSMKNKCFKRVKLTFSYNNKTLQPCAELLTKHH